MSVKKKFLWSSFSPKKYLMFYYKPDKKSLSASIKTILKFLADVSKKLPKQIKYLECGGGPVIYPLISISPKTTSITFSDYLKKNLKEIRVWQKSLSTIFNWNPFIAAALKYEGEIPSKKNILQREKLIKKKIKFITQCDIRKNNPLAPLQRKFDVVGVHFCADCITNSFEEWRKNIQHIHSLIRPGGWLILGTLERTKHWFAGPKNFPNVWLTEKSVRETLKKTGFRILYKRSFRGYFKKRRDSFLLFLARKQNV